MLAVKKRCESSFNCPKLCLCKYNRFLQSPRSAFENQIISVTMQEITEKIRNKSTKNLQSHLKCIKITKKSALCTAECTYHMAPLISHIFSLFFCSVIFAVLQLHLCRIYCRCAFFPLFFCKQTYLWFTSSRVMDQFFPQAETNPANYFLATNFCRPVQS